MLKIALTLNLLSKLYENNIQTQMCEQKFVVYDIATKKYIQGFPQPQEFIIPICTLFWVARFLYKE